MLAILIVIVLISWLVGLCVIELIFRHISPKFCHSIDELNVFINKKEKYKLLQLHLSNSNEKMLMLSSNKNKKIFCQKYLYQNLNYLIVLSKLIDSKINNGNNKYRAKNNKILIEEIASVVSFSVYLNNDCKLFKLYKNLNKKYNLKVKENKIFKLLLGQQLINRLYEMEEEIINISKIIQKSKSVKKIKKYKKKIYYYTQIYSIKKYNPNANKILFKQKFDYNLIAKFLFSELKEVMQKEKIIISYLKIMFS